MKEPAKVLIGFLSVVCLLLGYISATLANNCGERLAIVEQKLLPRPAGQCWQIGETTWECSKQ